MKEFKFLGCKCIVKVLKDSQDDEGFHKISIGKEMDAIKKLGNHPHIVGHSCHSKMDLDSESYLVMKLLQMDLEKVLHYNKRVSKGLSLVEAVSLMLQIGEGMKFMHDKGVAHCDLKPRNVLVNLEASSSGKSRIFLVKIPDFGSTKA